jgi:regulator of cell morphogenesis and NO signaling
MPAKRTLDVRGLPERELTPTVLGAFDSLVPGEALIVLGDYNCGSLLGRLREARKGLFQWSALELGPQRFRFELARRAARLGALREVCEALSWDHERLDALQEAAFERLAAGDRDDAVAIWADFTFRLRRHMRFEEEALFPLFEARYGGAPSSPGPTSTMRSEHREIEALLVAIGKTSLGVAALPLRERLRTVLGFHELCEEELLYPAADRALDAEQRDALVCQSQAS